MKFQLTIVLCSIALLGCKNGDTPAPEAKEPSAAAPAAQEGHEAPGQGGHEGHEHAGKEGHEAHGDHGKLPTQIQAFHDAFAPVWHIENKDERRKKYCTKEAAEKILAAMDGLGELKAPEGADAKAWELAKNNLEAHTSDADRVCGDDAAAFEKSLTGAHDALHEVMKLASGK